MTTKKSPAMRLTSWLGRQTFRMEVLAAMLLGSSLGQAVQAYSITGKVGLSGVTVTAGTKSAVSNASGVYTIVNLVAGTYTVKPTKTGCPFTPASFSVTITTGNKANVNFTSPCLLTYESSNNTAYTDAYIKDFPYGSTAYTSTPGGSGALTYSRPTVKPYDGTCCPPASQCGFSAVLAPTPTCMANIPFWQSSAYWLTGDYPSALCFQDSPGTHSRTPLLSKTGLAQKSFLV